MPFTKKRKGLGSSMKKKPWNKKRKGFKSFKKVNTFHDIKPTTMICKDIGGFASRTFARFKMAATSTLNFATANGFAVQNIIANGLITPDGVSNVSGVADWLGAPQFGTGATTKAPYTQYIVHSCKIKISAMLAAPATGTADVALVVCPMPPGVSGTNYSGSMLNLLEFPGCSRQILIQSTTGTLPQKIETGLLIRSAFGLTKEQYSANKNIVTDYSGNYNSNPASTINFIIVGQTMNGANDATMKVTLIYEVEYFVEFYQRNILITAAPA